MACGGSSSNTNTAVTTTNQEYNQQVGTSGGGIAVGAGATTGAITIQTPDNAALALASQALQHSTNTTGQALSAETAVATSALASNVQTAGAALASNAAVTGAAFSFGESALNAVQGTAQTAISAVQQSSANEETLLASVYAQNAALTQGALGGALSIAANAAPQSAAAQSEIQSGTTPLGGVAWNSSTVIVLAIAGVAALYFLSRR